MHQALATPRAIRARRLSILAFGERFTPPLVGASVAIGVSVAMAQ
jgi:hypothetical protein